MEVVVVAAAARPPSKFLRAAALIIFFLVAVSSPRPLEARAIPEGAVAPAPASLCGGFIGRCRLMQRAGGRKLVANAFRSATSPPPPISATPVGTQPYNLSPPPPPLT